MTREEALAALELDAAATSGDIDRAFEQHYNDLRIRLDNAPTTLQREKLQSRLERLEQAYTLLRGGTGAASYADLPASGPLDAEPTAGAANISGATGGSAAPDPEPERPEVTAPSTQAPAAIPAAPGPKPRTLGWKTGTTVALFGLTAVVVLFRPFATPEEAEPEPSAVSFLVSSDTTADLEGPFEVRVRHILWRLPPAAGSEQVESAMGLAQRVRQQALAGGDFDALARQFSEDDASRDTGGDLGFAGRGVYVVPFEQAAFGLVPGEISPPVRTQFGVHLIRLEERRPARSGVTAPANPSSAAIPAGGDVPTAGASEDSVRRTVEDFAAILKKLTQ